MQYIMQNQSPVVPIKGTVNVYHAFAGKPGSKIINLVDQNGNLGKRLRKSLDIAQDDFVYCSLDQCVYHLRKRRGNQANRYKLTKLPVYISLNSKPTPGSRPGSRRYQRVHIVKHGKDLHFDVHILMYLAWVGPIKKGMQIDHINGCATDNRPCNLEQVTPKENMRRYHRLRRLREKGCHTNLLIPDFAKQLFAMSDEEFDAFLTKYSFGKPLDLDREDMRHAEY